MNYFRPASELTPVSQSRSSTTLWVNSLSILGAANKMVVTLKGTFFPLLLLLSSYLQLLEVLLLHLLLCYHVRLVLNLVDLLRSAVRLNLRHYPGDRRLESRGHNLRGGGLRRYLQLVCGLKPKSLPLGRGAEQPAEQPASLPACSLTSPGWLDSVGCESWEGRSEGWWQSHAATRCDFDSTSPKKEKKEKKQAQEISVRKRAKETMVVVCRFFLNNYCLSL